MPLFMVSKNICYFF